MTFADSDEKMIGGETSEVNSKSGGANSITRWLPQARDGDEYSLHQLRVRYYERLILLVRSRIATGTPETVDLDQKQRVVRRSMMVRLADVVGCENVIKQRLGPGVEHRTNLITARADHDPAVQKVRGKMAASNAGCLKQVHFAGVDLEAVGPKMAWVRGPIGPLTAPSSFPAIDRFCRRLIACEWDCKT